MVDHRCRLIRDDRLSAADVAHLVGARLSGILFRGRRVLILELLQRLNDPDDGPFLEERGLTQVLGETRARGVTVRDSGEFRPQTGSISAPVCSGGNVLGCVSTIWIRTAMSSQKALDQFAEPLPEIASRIAGPCPTEAQSGFSAISAAMASSTATS